MSPDCEECGEDIRVDSNVSKPNMDWIKVVCSECGSVNDISLIRLSKGAKE